MKFGLSFAFEKSANSEGGKYVRGWASVVSMDGEPVEDFDGDRIEMAELRKAAHAFVKDHRVAKAMHKGTSVGEVVESVIIDDEFARAVGVDDTRRGWWIGMEITDEAVRKRVRDGELKAFSIGGQGKRRKTS